MDLPSNISFSAYGNRITAIIGPNHYHRTMDSGDLTTLIDLFTNYNAGSFEFKEEALKAINSILNPVTHNMPKEFEIVDNRYVTLKGIDLPVPESMTNFILNAVTQGVPVESISKFWVNCCLNPNDNARNKFFEYCLKFGVVITTSGYALLYKAVNQAKKSSPMVVSLFKEAVKIKDSKKGLSKFNLYENLETGEYQTFSAKRKTDPGEEWRFVGNVQSLYNDHLKDGANTTTEVVFTDKYTGRMEIRLGVPQKQDRKLCNDDIRVECSTGLHVGSYQYVRSYASIDDVILTVLVNPANIVAIPIRDSSKIRCCEYFPCGIITRLSDGTWKELDTKYFESDYNNIELRKLLDELKEIVKDLSDHNIEKKNIITQRISYLQS